MYVDERVSVYALALHAPEHRVRDLATASPPPTYA